MEKVTAYVTRRRSVHQHPTHPDFGLVVPGGTIEPGETPEAAATRELEEESGLAAPRAWQPLGAVRYLASDGAPTVRHYLHAVMDLPQDAWTHNVRSGDEDDGWVCHYFWRDLRADFLPEPGGRLGARLDALLRALVGETAPFGRK